MRCILTLKAAAHHKTERTAKASKKLTKDEVRKIALQTVPGTITDVAIEKKLGANRYVVEIIAKQGGAETDVIIDMETGKILATEK